MKKMIKPAQISALFALFCTNSLNSQGAGLEKSVLWSGEVAGTAGSSSLTTLKGSQSLAFNPAGLGLDSNMDFSIHLSPTFIQSTSPGHNFDHIQKSDHFGIIPAMTFKFAPIRGKNLGVAFGIYPVGGSKSSWKSNEDLSSWKIPDDYEGIQKSELQLVEYSMGSGLDLGKGFSLGASIRMVEGRSQTSSSQIVRFKHMSNETFATQTIHGNDLKGVDLFSYKVGVLYQAPDENFGMGVSYRSSNDIKMKGTVTGVVHHLEGSALHHSRMRPEIPTTEFHGSRQIDKSPLEVTVHFPSQISYGFYIRPIDNNRLFFTHNKTYYSHTKTIQVRGKIIDPLTNSSRDIPDIEHNWKDMNNYRFGIENTALASWTFRTGYTFTDRVTHENYARDTFSAPGIGHTLTIGAGKQINKNWNIDAAYEFSQVSGIGRTTQKIPDENQAAVLEVIERQGRFTNTAHGAHMSIIYNY